MNNLLPHLAQVSADAIAQVRQHLLGDSDFPAEMRPYLEKYRHSEASNGTPQSAAPSGSAATAAPEVQTITCSECNGTGLLPPAERQRLVSAAVAATAGTGGSAKVDIKCRTCRGAGVVQQESR